MNKYYDLDDILSEAEPIPCTFNVDALGLGYLDACSGSVDMTSGTRVELPFWLIETLVPGNMVTIELPKCFDKNFKKSLLADPRVVDLRECCFYFYELGHKLSIITKDPDLSDMLLKALSVRYLELIRRDPEFRSRDFSSFTSLLTNLEKRLFDLKSDGIKGKSIQKLKEAPIVVDMRHKTKKVKRG